MHFPRIAPSLVLLALSAYPAWGQDSDNPFARWEQLRKETVPATKEPAAPAASTSSGRNLEYFSADAGEQPAAKTPVTNRVKQERLAVGPTPPATVGKSASAPEKPLSSGSPAANEKTQSQPEKPNPAASRGARTAVFSDKTNTGGVQQTSSEFFGESTAPSAAPNPFAEFLEGEIEAPVSNPATPSSPTAPEPEPAFAEPSEPLPTTLPDSLRGPQSPSVTLEWVHHDEFSIGQECRCDLVVENTGRSAVRNVVAEAVLPKGMKVVSADPAPAAAAGSARWTFPELLPGQSRTIQLVVIPGQRGDFQMNAFVQVTGATSSSVSVTEPMVAIKLEGPKTVEVGQQVGITVHVTNPGTGKAKNVVIQAALPEGLEHRQGSLLTVEIGTLNPGELRRARLSLTAVRGGEQNIAARVVAEGGLSNETAQLVAVAEPRLNIGLRGPKTQKAGQPGEYELVVVNEGNVDSNNVRAKYKVPAGYEFVAADAGGKFSPEDQTIEWFLGTLEPNRARQFRVTLLPKQPGEGHHQVGVISEHGGMTMADHRTKVEGKAELTLLVAAAKRQVQRGDENVFEVRIENQGSSVAESVGLSCELPPALELLDVSGPSEYIADNGVIIFRSLPKIESGDTAVFAIRTRCKQAGSHKLRARVASESISEPVIGQETIVGR